MQKLTAEEQEAVKLFSQTIDGAIAIFQSVSDLPPFPVEDGEKLRILARSIQVQAITHNQPENREFINVLLANLVVAYQLGRKESGGFW